MLSIVALALLFLSSGLSSVLSAGLGIAGLIVGRKGRRKVDAGETRQHRGLAQAGFVIGIVATVLSVIATAIWVTILILAIDGAFDDATTDEYFRDQLSAVPASVRVGALALQSLL